MARTPALLLEDRLDALALDDVQQGERGTRGTFCSTFELGDIAGGDVEQAREDRLAHVRTLPHLADFLRREDRGPGRSLCAENAHGDLVGETLAQKSVLRHLQQRLVDPRTWVSLSCHRAPPLSLRNQFGCNLARW